METETTPRWKRVLFFVASALVVLGGLGKLALNLYKTFGLPDGRVLVYLVGGPNRVRFVDSSDTLDLAAEPLLGPKDFDGARLQVIANPAEPDKHYHAVLLHPSAEAARRIEEHRASRVALVTDGRAAGPSTPLGDLVVEGDVLVAASADEAVARQVRDRLERTLGH